MAKSEVCIFSGYFETEDEAFLFSQEQWKPEPENGSDEDYAEWDETNPSWALKDELGWSMDSDFIETIVNDDKISLFRYLKGVLVEPEYLAEIQACAGEKANTLVLIYLEAMRYGGLPEQQNDLSKLKFCGKYRANT